MRSHVLFARRQLLFSVLLILVCGTFFACVEAERYTAVHVAVDADAYVRARAVSYRVETKAETFEVSAERRSFPFFVTVEAAPRTASTGEITVRALDEKGDTIVRRIAQVTTVSGAQRRLTVYLTEFCAQSYAACEDDGKSCNGCACVSRGVSSDELELIDVEVPVDGVRVRACGANPSDGSDASVADAGDADTSEDGGGGSSGTNGSDGSVDVQASISVASDIASGICTELSITAASGAGRVVLSAGMGSATYYSDPGCTAQATEVDVGQTSKAIYVIASLPAGTYVQDLELRAGTSSARVTVRRAARHVTTGALHTCVELDDASLWCWGNKAATKGALNISVPPSIVAVATRVLSAGSVLPFSAAAGGSSTCVVTSAGAARCLGAASELPSVKEGGGLSSGVTQIAVSDQHGCALHNGVVKCFSSGTSDPKLGPNRASANQASAATVPFDGKTVLEVGAGRHHSCALVTSAASGDEVYCWGDGVALGQGSVVSDSDVPLKVSGLPNGTLRHLTLDGLTSCVLASGAPYCWGSGRSGIIGPVGSSDLTTPKQKTGLSGVTIFDHGESAACAVVSGQLLCWGANLAGELAVSTITERREAEAVPGAPSAITDISLGGVDGSFSWAGHVCVIARGLVHCWGRDDEAQTGTTLDLGLFSSPRGSASTIRPDHLASGIKASCLVSGGKPSCWGRVDEYALGSQSSDGVRYRSHRAEPYPVSDTRADYGKVVTNGDGFCAIRGTEIVCWGQGFWGQKELPTVIYSANGQIMDLDAGAGHLCWLVQGGTDAGMWCRGTNAQGQIGDGSATSAIEQHQVYDGTASVLDLLTMRETSCAVFADRVECWGEAQGPLASASASPVKCSPDISPRTFVSGAGEDYGACVLLSDGNVYCRGANLAGNFIDSSPELSSVESLSGHGPNVCALTKDKRLFCAGKNDYGQLGDGTLTTRASFGEVLSLMPPVSAFSVGTSPCALDAQGLKCWGNNQYRQLALTGTPFTVRPSLVASWVNP